MKKIYLLVLLSLTSVLSFALNGPSTPVGPGTGYSGTTAYCVGATATPIIYNYSECSIGVGPATGVNCTATWYYNTTNTTTISGSTVLVSSTSFTSAAGTNGDLPSFTPLTTTAGTYYYFCVVTWTDPGTCPSPFVTATKAVTINANPAAIAGSSTVCVGSTMTLSDATGGGTWSSSDGTVATVGLNTGVVTGVASGNADITYTITSTGCIAISNITVNPLPASITGTASVCLGGTMALSSATPGGNWTSSNAAVATVNTSGVVSSVAAGTATISYTLPTGCTQTQVVTVNAYPVNISGTTTVCTGLTTTLSDGTPGGTWSSSDPTVAIISSTGVVTSVAAGTADITYMLASGCYKTTTVTVNQSPAAISGTPSVCNGLTTTLTDATAGGIWSSSNSSIASVNFSTGVVTGSGNGVATITYTLGSGCRTVVSFTVNASPSAIGGNPKICIGNTTTLTNSTAGGAWSSSNTAVATVGVGTGVVTSVATGNSDISYTLPDGCFSVSTVSVNPLPSPITGTAVVCSGATTTLTNADAGGTWASSAAAIASVGVSSGIVTGGTAGTATITYTLPTACKVTTVVTVNSLPAAITGTASLCALGTTTLSSTTSGGAWTTSDPSVATVSGTGVVSGVAAGNAVITYTIGTGCFRTVTVTVNALPSAISGTTEFCSASTSAFTNATPGGVWASSNGSVAIIGSASGIATGNVAGTATISYTLSTGCAATAAITVDPLPSPITGAPAVCVGSSFSFSDATAGGTWSSSDNTIATVTSAGVVTGVAVGVVNISYVLSTGCYRTVTITINPTPSAITGNAPLCPGTTTTLSSATAGGTWTSDNGAIASVGSSSGVLTGVAAGVTNITYKLSTGCATSVTATTNPLPAIPSGTPSVCVGNTTTFTDATAGGAWTSSNTAVATVVSTTGVITGAGVGVADITYTLGTGCYRTRTVTVNGLPAGITGTTEFCVGSTSSLADATAGGTWSSSTTSVATINNTSGVATGVASGTATITYTLGTGCTTTTVVTVDPLPSTISGSANVCIGLTTTLTDATSGGIWTSSNGAIASIGAASGVVTGNAPGLATMTYTLSTGCFRTFAMTVNALPAAIGGTLEVCAGSTTTLTDASTGGVWSSGATGVAVIGATTGIVTGLSAGTADITYTVAAGCTATATVTVDPLPAVITGASSLCLGATSTLANATSGGTWTSSNSAVASVGSTTGVVTGNALGNAVITYIIATGCYRTLNVTVNSLPAAITGTGVVCVSSTTVLSNATAGGTWSSGSTGIATVGASSGIVSGVSSGTAVISYTVSTGCASTTVVTVNPLPAVITGTPTVCLGLTTTLDDVTGTGTWSSSNSTIASVGSTTGVVTGNATGSAVISYILGTGCYRTQSVTVNNVPAAIAGPGTVCSGSTISLTDATAGGTWSSSNGAVATVGSTNGVVTGVSAGNADITYRVTATGCIAITTITVNAVPSSITGTTSVCLGATSALSSGTPGGVWSSSNTTVAPISAGGVVTASATGVATISYTLGTGCYTTTGFTVNALPAAITGTASVCVGATTTLSNATPGGSWSSSVPANATIGSANGVVTGVAAGNTDITYTVAATGCTSSITVTVNPLPAAITGTPTVCVGGTTALANATGGGVWSSSNASIASVNATGTVTGVAAGTATITYKLGTNCYSTQTVTVNGLPSTITGTATVCEGLTTTLSDVPAGGVWTSGSANATIGSSNGIVTGVTAGTADITYTLGTGCQATTVVTVNQSPANITGTPVMCSGSTTTLADATAGGLWSSSNAGVANIGFSTGIITGGLAGTATITYTLGNGCKKTTPVTVNPTPATIGGPGTVCVGSLITLTDASAGGTWNSGTPANASIGVSTGVVVGNAAGTSDITYTLPAGCATITTITVNPLPAAIAGTAVVCAGSTTTLTDASIGGSWTSSATGVATIGSGSGIASGISAGTSTISYILPTGCKTSTVLTVNSIPAGITGTQSICVGGVTTLSNATPGGSWSSSDVTVAPVGTSTGIVNGLSAGTAVISYTIASGCYRTVVVTVNTVPGAITGSTIVCTGSTSTLSNPVAGGTWSSSNPSIASIGLSTGIVTGGAAGNSTITYKLASGCMVTTIATVNPIPAIVTGPSQVCVGSSVTMTDATTGGSWSSSDPTVASIGSSTGITMGLTPGTSIISYSLATGCFRSLTITVNPLPAAITGTPVLCVGSTTTLSNATPAGTWYSSLPGVATINSSGVVTGFSGGTTTVTYTIVPGCYTTQAVTVNPLPATITGTPSVCSGSTTTFADVTPGGTWASSASGTAAVGSSTGIITGGTPGSAIITYTLPTGCFVTRVVTVNSLPAAITGTGAVCVGSTTTLADATAGGGWSSSATSIATITSSGVVTGSNVGTTTITYALSTGCFTTTVVTVNGLPSLITGVMSVCLGNTTTLNNATPGGAWTSSNTNATIDPAGVVTGANVGTSVITYTLGTGCYRTSTVTVQPLPAAIGGPTVVCAGSTITLTDATTGGTWSSSDATVATVNSSTGVVTGVANGFATITYTLGTGCITTVNITVNPLPAVITGPSTVCVGSTIVLADATTGGLWSSSTTNATVDASGNVLGVSPGTAIISYTIGTGCYKTKAVTVNALPAAIGGTLSVCTGFTTNLTNATGGGTWSSSDATVATVGFTGGVVTGVAPGTSNITYTLSTGCVSVAMVTVNALPAAITGSLVVCATNTTSLADATAGGAWSSSNTAVATIDAFGVASASAAGTTVISYTLSTGCYRTAVLTVNGLPSAIGGSLTVCEGLTTVLSATPAGGTWTSSSTANATVSGAGVVTGVLAGTSTITYTLGTGCFRTADVTVNTTPTAITGSAAVCLGATTTLGDAVAGGVWSSSNASVASIDPAGVVTGNAVGTAVITYALGTGCKAIKVVTVNGLPAVITGTTLVCEGSTTILSDVTGGGSWSSSNTLTATVGSGSGVVTGVAAGVATITYTTATGCFRTTNVTVNTAPTAITGTMVVCASYTTTLANTVPGGIWSSSNATVATIDASGVVTANAAGTATITYTLGTGCFRTAVVTVNTTPSAFSGTPVVCQGAASNLTTAPAGGTWTSSDVSVAIVSSTGSVNGVNPGTANITYTLSTGCLRVQQVTVNAAPAAITGTLVACAGQTTTLADATPGGAWNSSNTTIATVDPSGVVTGANTGTATITYTTTTGCSTTAVVTINASPSTIAGTNYVCEGLTTNLTATPAGGNWSSSDPSVAVVSPTGVVTGSVAGTTTITYGLITGCYSTALVTVYQTPPAFSGASAVCVGSSVTFTDALPGGNWTSANTSIATAGFSTGVITGIAAGTTTITYTTTSNCKVTGIVTVQAQPATIGGVANLCIGSVSTLTDATPGGTWSSLDPSVVTVGAGTGIITGISTGTAVVSYTAGNGCARTTVATVNPNPASIGGTLSVCVGSATFLTDAVTGGTWSSSNVSIATIGSTTGIMTGVNAGTVNITYTLSTGCRSISNATVAPIPAAITGTPTVCIGTTTILSSATFGGAWSSANPAIASVDVSGVVTGNATGIVTISYAVSSGCARTINVTVNPTPSPITGTMSICIGSSTTLFNATSGGSWSSGNTLVANVGLTSGVVTSVSAGTATISYTIASGCRQTAVVTVNPLPSSITGSTIICNGSSTTLNNAVTGGTWSSSSSAVATVGVTTGIVTGMAPGTVTITYSLGSGCRTSTVVTVNTLPGPITGVTNVCEGGTTVLSNGTTGGSWSSSNTTVATISATGSVLGIAAGTSVISYTMPTGCARVTTMNVNPIPPAIGGFTSICLGMSSTLTNAMGGGIWSSSNPSIANINITTGVTDGLNAGTVTITYTLGTGCMTTTGFTVNALPAPITGTAIVCQGLTTTLSNSIAGGTWVSADTLTATVGISTGVVTGVNPGYDTLYYIVGGSCSSSIIVTVNPTPPSIVPIVADLCIGSADTLTNTIGGGTWSSSNTAVAPIGLSSGIVSGLSAGTSSVTYTLGAGCYTVSSVIVHTMPAPITGIANVCIGSYTTLSDVIAGGTWTSNDPSVASVVSTSGIVTGIASGTATVDYTLAGGCQVSKVVTVNPLPSPINGPIPSAPLEVCAGSSTTLSTAAAAGVWSSSNPAIASIGLTSGIASGITAGTTNITYTILGTGCYTTSVLSVNPSPAPITGSFLVCEGATTTLSSASISGTWASSNTSLAIVGVSSGIVSGLAAGLVDITYTLPTGCYTTVPFGINPSPAPITGTPVVCEGSTITLTDATSFGTWSSSNTAVATAGSVSGAITGVSAGTATITYMMGTGCYSFIQLTVNPIPAPLTGPASVCVGSAIFISSPSAGGTWSSDNVAVATVDAGGNVYGAAPGNALISYTLSTGCRATVDVTVEPTPSAITGVGSTCVGSTTTLTDAFIGGVWSSANTAIATIGSGSGIVTGVAGGTTTITYSSPIAGCHVTTVVTVTPLPGAIVGASNVCVGSTISLADPTVGGTWSSSNIAVATITSSGVVTGVTANTAIISYTVASGCSATSVITVNALPFADTIVGPTHVCIGASISLSNSVTGGTWMSSDTAVLKINTTTGVATGFTAGTVAVTYTITNLCGTATAVRTVVVDPLADAGVIAGTLSTCVGYTTTLGSSVPGGVWSSSDTVKATVNSLGIVTGHVAGVVTINYAVTTGCGTAYATANVTVYGSAPVAHISIHPDTVMCSNVKFQNFGASAGQPSGVTYTWTAVNATVNAIAANKQNALISFPEPGLAIVKLTTNVLTSGCIATDSFVANISETVAGDPEVKYYNSLLICTDNTADSYQWGYDDVTTLDSTEFVGETHQDFYLPVPDFTHRAYWVMSNHGGCLQKSYYNEPTSAGPVVVNTADFRLFPNPADSRINIEVNGTNKLSDINVKIFDMLGKTVYDGTLVNGKGSVSVAELSAGVYSVLILQDGNKLGAKNFVKQ